MSQTKFRAETTIITPQIATEFLKRNTINRKLSNATINDYAKDMQCGKWDFNGESIKISIDGILLDGQHRLWAVIVANTNVKMLVVYGVSEIGNIDVGMKRNSTANMKFTYNIDDYDSYKAADVKLIHDMLYGRVKASIHEEKQIYDYFKSEIEQVHSLKNITASAARIRVALEMAMKLYNIQYYQIERFLTVFNTGFTNGDHENKAIACRIVMGRKEYAHARTDREKVAKLLIINIHDFALGRTGRQITPIKEIDFRKIKADIKL